MSSISHDKQFRFTYRSLDFALKAASRLKNAMREHRPDFRKGTSQAFLAQICGYRDWKELASSVDPASLDPIDQAMPWDAVAERRNLQIDRLIRLTGLEWHSAADTIHDTEPTGSCSGRLRLWRNGMEPYFKLDPLPDGAFNMDAFRNILAAYDARNISVFRSLSYLESMLTETETDVHVKSTHAGTHLEVTEKGRAILSVQYNRHIRPMVWGADIKPLRPDIATFRVAYGLWEMHHLQPENRRTTSAALDRAYAAAGYFILTDILLTSCLHSQSLDTSFDEVQFELDVIEGAFGMEEMGDSIATAYEEVMDFEDEMLNDPEEMPEYTTERYAISYVPLRDILPFDLISVADHDY
jgi:hypothetical protein